MDPVVNPDVGGLGDVSVTTKTVLLNGNNLQITQILRCDIPTGSRRQGPWHRACVARARACCSATNGPPKPTFSASWNIGFRLGGDPTIDGQVLQYGFGISHLLYENRQLRDHPHAGIRRLDRFRRRPNSPTGIRSKSTRWASSTSSPACASCARTRGANRPVRMGRHGFPIASNRWYDANFLLEIRFVF